MDGFEADTIVAVATPPGRGGIAVVRVSGPQAPQLLLPVLRLRHPLAAGRVRFGELIDAESGALLDQVLVTLFAAPHSYTGDDVVELALHGAPVLADYVLRAALRGGARLAEPGEFTRRAVLAGRMDLTQAEAVHDLVAAATLEQARQAAAQLGGAVSRQVAPAKDALLDLIAELEAGIDFAEDDLAPVAAEQVTWQLARIRVPLEQLAASFAHGRRLREGATLAIVGRPNAGKSSLFNRLLAQERAIVTAQPGTTRDPIAETLAIAGVPVELIDTAGLREAPAGPEGEAEREGIRRSRMALADADLVLMVVDATTIVPGGPHPEDAALMASLAGRAHVVVVNKIDLAQGLGTGTVLPDVIYTSASIGAGIAELREALAARLLGDAGAIALSTERGVLTNLRQQQAVTEALDAMDAAAIALKETLPHEFVLLDLGRALASLDALTGATAEDEVLHRIFAKFCIGK